MLISLKHMFVMIRSFYKYARNWYLGDSLNNLYARNQYEWFLYVHQYQSRLNIIIFCKNTNEWEWWTWIPIFPIDSYTSFTLLYLISCKFTIQTTFSNEILHIVLYLVNFILENSIVPCRFDIRIEGQFITSDTVHVP